MKQVIITGANGFVGSHVVKELLKQGIKVIAVVRNEQSDIECISHFKDLEIVYCDLNEISKLDNLVDSADTFYHFAWDGSAGVSRNDYTLQLNNVIWTVECLKVANKIGCKRFIGAGSIMEKETLSATYNQGTKVGLPYIYGTGKVAAHAISKAVASDLGIDLIWGYITNAYGAGELSPRFINETLRKIINKKPLQFTAATQNYDFIYIEDVAKAFYLIGEKGKAFYEYTIGSGQARPLKQFILTMKDTLAPNQEFLFGDIPFTGVNLGIEEFDINLLKEHTGFEQTISFQAGIILTKKWLQTMEKGML